MAGLYSLTECAIEVWRRSRPAFRCVVAARWPGVGEGLAVSSTVRLSAPFIPAVCAVTTRQAKASIPTCPGMDEAEGECISCSTSEFGPDA